MWKKCWTDLENLGSLENPNLTSQCHAEKSTTHGAWYVSNMFKVVSLGSRGAVISRLQVPLGIFSLENTIPYRGVDPPQNPRGNRYEDYIYIYGLKRTFSCKDQAKNWLWRLSRFSRQAKITPIPGYSQIAWIKPHLSPLSFDGHVGQSKAPPDEHAFLHLGHHGPPLPVGVKKWKLSISKH